MSDDLKRPELLKTFIGNKPDALIVLGSDQWVITVCSQFGIYVKFSTDVSNDLINFPMCTECKKGQKPIKRPKTKN